MVQALMARLTVPAAGSSDNSRSNRSLLGLLRPLGLIPLCVCFLSALLRSCWLLRNAALSNVTLASAYELCPVVSAPQSGDVHPRTPATPGFHLV
jgi:hypothetical protein